MPDNFVAQGSRYSSMKEVTVEEIYVFMRLYLYRGKLFLMNLVLQYLVLLCQAVVLFSYVPTFPSMTKELKEIDGNMITLRP